MALAGTERRRQRPTDATQQREPDSGKKKAHTDKNLLLVNDNRGKVVYLGPPLAGKPHAKKAADAVQSVYPANATLATNPGFHGYEPAGVLTAPPQKSRKARN